MKRIYHVYSRWECFPAGFYEPQAPNGMKAKEANDAYAAFLKDIPRFEAALARVINEWPNSCEHYLSNETMNRIAWLGQASMCIDSRIPSGFRGGFNLLVDDEKQAANEAALKYLNLWLEKQGEPQVDMEGAGVSAKVNLY